MNHPRLESLERQHQELEKEIENVASSKSAQVDVGALKRKKLHIKEQIEELKRQLN